jgi:hypothetical protein
MDAPMMWALSPFKTSIRKQLMDSYASGFIPLKEVVDSLTEVWSILKLPDIAKREAETRYWYESTKEKVDQIIDKFTKGMIEEPDLRTALAEYIKDPKILEDYVERGKIRRFRKPLEERLPEQKKFILGTLQSLYKERIIEEPQFKTYLSQADTINDFEALALLRASLARLYDEEMDKMKKKKEEADGEMKLAASILTSCYKEGYISKETLESELEKARAITDLKAAYVFRAEWAKFFEEETEKRKKEKEEAEGQISLLAGILTNCYKQGYISKELFESELTKAKKIEKKEPAYILRAEWEKFFEEETERRRKEKEDAEGQIALLSSILIDIYSDGYIDETLFKSELAKAKQIKEREPAYILKGQWAKFREVTKQQIELLKDNFEKDIITEGTFYNELKNLGIEDWKIANLVEEMEIKKYGKKISPEEKLLSEYRSLRSILDKSHKEGFIDATTVRSVLMEVRTWTDPYAILKVRAEWEYDFDLSKIRVQEAEELFLRDIITEAELLERLKREIVIEDKLTEVYTKTLAEKAKATKG